MVASATKAVLVDTKELVKDANDNEDVEEPLESAIKADIDIAKSLAVAKDINNTDITMPTPPLSSSMIIDTPEKTLNESVGLSTNIGKQLTISLPLTPTGTLRTSPVVTPTGTSVVTSAITSPVVTPSGTSVVTPTVAPSGTPPGASGASTGALLGTLRTSPVVTPSRISTEALLGTPSGASGASSGSSTQRSSIDSTPTPLTPPTPPMPLTPPTPLTRTINESREEGDTLSNPDGPAKRSVENREYDKYSDETLKDMYLYTDKYHDIDYNEFKDIRDYATGLLNQPRRPDANNKIGRLSSDIDTYNYNINGVNGANAEYDTKNIIEKINRFENDPDNPIEALTIRFEDRLVFIITTFFIRFATLAIIQRAIDISVIKTFYEGFIYYGCIYILLFWFFVFFINVDNNYDIAYLNVNVVANYIRSLFFYFYMGTNGISRLIIHSLLIIVIIVIPIILNIKNIKDGDKDKDKDRDMTDDSTDGMEKIKLLSLEERTKLSKMISLFTLFIWILTSIIASKF